MARILLLEPDAILADQYGQALLQAGHTVYHQKSAQTSIHIMDSDQPDIIVMELQLAEHNGLEFLYEIRSYPEWQSLPVILLSIVPMADMTKELAIFNQLGVVDFLYKPTVKLDHIVRAVERFVPAVT